MPLLSVSSGSVCHVVLVEWFHVPFLSFSSGPVCRFHLSSGHVCRFRPYRAVPCGVFVRNERLPVPISSFSSSGPMCRFSYRASPCAVFVLIERSHVPFLALSSGSVCHFRPHRAVPCAVLVLIERFHVAFLSLSRDSGCHSCLTQLCAIRDRAETLVAGGFADKIIAEKQQDRNDAWFERASVYMLVYVSPWRTCGRNVDDIAVHI